MLYVHMQPRACIQQSSLNYCGIKLQIEINFCAHVNREKGYRRRECRLLCAFVYVRRKICISSDGNFLVKSFSRIIASSEVTAVFTGAHEEIVGILRKLANEAAQCCRTSKNTELISGYLN